MKSPSKYIDHTNLAPGATAAEISQLTKEAAEYDFCSVCVNPRFVKQAADELKDSDVKVCTVIGFPLGANATEIKVAETKLAIEQGADEVDMVIPVGAALEGDFETVEDDIRAVVEAAADRALVKVILETCLLNEEQIIEVCKAAMRAGADYVKTSTGFSTGGATVPAVKLMRATVGESMGVKASGGVRTPEDFKAMVDAGASRIGASAGTKLLEGIDR